ncbi:hypothetical protein ACFL1S_02660 [Pseudomonadota bacterium]
MDSNKSNARRKLLKAVLAGGGVVTAAKTLPEKWTAPAIKSVILPAHAAVSPKG